MNKIIPISDLQTSAKKYVEQVRETDEPVIVTAGKSQRGSGQLRKLRGPAGHPGAHAEYRSTAVSPFRIAYRLRPDRAVEVAFIRDCRRRPLPRP